VDINDASRIKVGELPELEIMPIDQIVFHEEPDNERSSSLKNFIQKDGKLKNPPMVAYYENSAHYILLDGANRVTALKELNIQDIIVQKVDLFDPDLQFLHWHHAVEKFQKEEFLEKLRAIQGAVIEKYPMITVSHEENSHYLCQVQFSDETTFRVFADGSLFDRVRKMNQVTDIYHGFKTMDRVSYTNLEHLKQHYPDFCAVVCFQKITKEELVRVVKNKMKLPSGVTRIILPKRALRLNVPLDILRFQAPVAEKNHWLQQRINLQVKDKSIRFYYEPTFMFDE